MEKLRTLFERSRYINLILFLCSFGIYFFYFHPIFLNINSTLSSITADSLKNYYTYVYHIKNDTGLLHFSGMNYPYGEHIIYTDCQPLLTFILRLLPFTHNYLIGIMHSLIFFSFIISPLILHKILRLLGIDSFSSFFTALAIALLSPQFVKINAGHFALAYGCLIPMSFLFTLNYLKENTSRPLLILFVFNMLLFLLHPYLGFCLSLFSFLAIFLFHLFHFDKKTILKKTILSVLVGILPLTVFKLFMALTDQHINRTTEPYGAEMMVENLDSILSPTFGPFRSLMEHFLPDRTGHYEGHTYLGFYTILLFVVFLLLLPFMFKRIKIKKESLVILLPSLVFLLVAFGVHIKVLNYFHVQIPALNQFRAVCRFAWIFYFALPLFLISTLYESLKGILKPGTFIKTTTITSVLFFSINMTEANFFFTKDASVFWKYRNFFHEGQLNEEEGKILASLRRSEPQAILPLPLFHGGSEMYERPGSNNSMIPSMIYSYHSNTPILSVLMSRTSLNETKEMIQLLNSYKKEKPVQKLLGTHDFFVLTTHDALLPDETRLLSHVKNFAENDTLKYGYISVKELLSRKTTKSTYILSAEKAHLTPDTTSVIFLPHENRKPFLAANIMDYETVFSLDSNQISTGTYVLSFHYHYDESTYRALGTNLIVNSVNTKGSEWINNIPIRILSGFYDGFGIFEYRLELEKQNKYEFLLKGYVDHTYRVSHFLLRPEARTVMAIDHNKDTLFNNFPK